MQWNSEIERRRLVSDLQRGIPDCGDDCLEALQELYTFLDGELTPERREGIRVHLDECRGCVEAFDFEVELREVVSRCCRDTEVPDELRSRIALAIESLSDSDGEASEVS